MNSRVATTAPGVFFGREVLGLDLFFGLLSFFFFLFLVLHGSVFLVCGFCCVSGTEKQLVLALNVLC
jgi:hypothetical protein